MVRYTVPRMPRVVAVPLGALLCALALLAPAGPVRGVAPAVAQADRGLAGQLLVATEGLQDPRFARTVVYVVRHDADGAFGLVVNRPGKKYKRAARSGKYVMVLCAGTADLPVAEEARVKALGAQPQEAK